MKYPYKQSPISVNINRVQLVVIVLELGVVQSVALGQAQRWLRWAVWAHVSGLLPFDALLRADHTHTLEGYCFFFSRRDVGWKVPFCQTHFIVGHFLSSFSSCPCSFTVWENPGCSDAFSEVQECAAVSIFFGNDESIAGRHLHEMEKHIFCPFQSFSCAGIWLDQLVLLIHSTHITVVFHNSMRLSYCPIPETIWNVDLLMPMGC